MDHALAVFTNFYLAGTLIIGGRPAIIHVGIPRSVKGSRWRKEKIEWPSLAWDNTIMHCSTKAVRRTRTRVRPCRLPHSNDGSRAPARSALSVMRNSYEHILPPSWKSIIASWLAEDTPSFDYAGYIVGEAPRDAFLFGKGNTRAVLAGSPFFNEIFAQLGCEVEWYLHDGDSFEPVRHIATVRGKARHILLGERIALNLLARCSGIATRSRMIKDLAKSYGYNGIIAGTRKTTPGFRLVENMIMLKDNHIWSSGSITAAVQQARTVGGFSLLLEVEVQSESEADEAIDAGADIVMLDNMEGEELAGVAHRLKEKWKGKRKFRFESSGNITEQNLKERAMDEIDILSTSFVHQSVPHVDFSLKIQKPQGNGISQ